MCVRYHATHLLMCGDVTKRVHDLVGAAVKDGGVDGVDEEEWRAGFGGCGRAATALHALVHTLGQASLAIPPTQNLMGYCGAAVLGDVQMHLSLRVRLRVEKQ